MQAHVEQPELDLPHHRKRGTRVATLLETFEEVLWQRFTRFGVRRTAFKHLVAPGKIFHELAGQLDGVPGHAVDAGNAGVIDPREQVVQHVPEFVEDGYHIIMRKQ